MRLDLLGRTPAWPRVTCCVTRFRKRRLPERRGRLERLRDADRRRLRIRHWRRSGWFRRVPSPFCSRSRRRRSGMVKIDRDVLGQPRPVGFAFVDAGRSRPRPRRARASTSSARPPRSDMSLTGRRPRAATTIRRGRSRRSWAGHRCAERVSRHGLTGTRRTLDRRRRSRRWRRSSRGPPGCRAA